MSKQHPVAPVSGSLVSTHWHGPIPDPESLAALKKLIPDAPERLLAMAEDEARVRRELMQRDHESASLAKELDVKSYHLGVSRGQWMAFLLLVLVITSSVVCSLNGDTKTAIAIASVGIVNIASTFIGRKQRT